MKVTHSWGPRCSKWLLWITVWHKTYVPITFEGETEFEFDICDNIYAFNFDTNQIIGGNPRIDDNDNAIYNLRWTVNPSDPNKNGFTFIGLPEDFNGDGTNDGFNAIKGTYELIISDGTCESEPIEFAFNGNENALSIGGLLSNGEISQG